MSHHHETIPVLMCTLLSEEDNDLSIS